MLGYQNKLSLLYIFLTVAYLNLSSQANATQADPCSVALELDPHLPTERIISFTQMDPLIHVMNMKDFLKQRIGESVKNTIAWEKLGEHTVPSPQSEVETIIYPLGPTIPFLYEGRTQENLIKLRGLGGIKVVLESESLDRIRIKEVSEYQVDEWESKIKIQEKHRTTLKLNDVTAESLALSQMIESNSKISMHEFADKYHKRILNANRAMLKILLTEKHLEIVDLDQMNLEINGDREEASAEAFFYQAPSSNIDLFQATGIIRGSGPQTVAENMHGKRVVVDLRGAQMMTSHKAFFVPAFQVPSLMKNLLLEINKIDKKTSIPMIVELFQTFLKIHPYVEGNGRTSRVLLDYMLLKAGFLPAVHHKFLQDLYYTAHEIALKVYEE